MTPHVAALCYAACVVPQSVLDAQADAETLVLFMRDGRHFCDLSYPDGWQLGFLDLGVGVRKHLRRGWYERAASAAESAARAAFRAVPGLRA